jgi:hypothetical protein
MLLSFISVGFDAGAICNKSGAHIAFCIVLTARRRLRNSFNRVEPEYRTVAQHLHKYQDTRQYEE